MANPFLNKTDLMDRDIETAILLEQAIVHDIGNAVAYTDGTQVFLNTEDNLYKILPAYNQLMLKWLLKHEEMHLLLKHHNRFYKYLAELSKEETKEKFHVTKDEVNIIMDILVHDSLCRMFPELVDTALANLAQMRNRNSLKYTFKTYTLEEMLEEYSKQKEGNTDKSDGEGTTDEKSEEEKDGEKDESKKGHGEGGEDSPEEKGHKPEDGEPEIKDESERPEPLPDEHDKTDWSKLDEIDSKEFITNSESESIKSAVERLKRKKFKLAKLTETLNGLVTSQRRRTYAKPNPIKVGGGIVLKGSTPGRTQLYLIFDASGSMSYEMDTFKEIIGKGIPQAMDMPCEWFAGRQYSTLHSKQIEPYKTEHGDGYYKGKFKDFIPVSAYSGYNDDGDRTIELCWLAEQQGYSPIGVTDGGGSISWSKDKLKQLKRTVLVGQNSYWLKQAKEINPLIQILDI